MLNPQRAVLVERCDALGRRYELRATLCRGRLNEFDNRLFRRSVVPRRQGVSFRLGGHAQYEQNAQCKDTNNRSVGSYAFHGRPHIKKDAKLYSSATAPMRHMHAANAMTAKSSR